MVPAILIVEDEVSALRFFTTLLASEGYTVIGASTLAEGARICREWKPQLLIVDSRLPDGEGLDLIQDSLSFEYPPAVILTSGAISPGMTTVANRLGGAVIQKPASIPAILDAVTAALGTGGSVASV